MTDASQSQLSLRRQWASKQAISFLMQQGIENPDVISLAAGFVDFATLPTEKVRVAASKILSDEARAMVALQYGTTQGSEVLRQHCLKHVAQLEGCSVDDLGIDESQMVLTTGSQQLLSLVGNVLLNPGDICIVSAPTYFVFLGTLEGLNAKVVAVPADEDGFCPDELEKTFQAIEAAGELDRVKMVYVVSEFDNPRGVGVSDERRNQLIDVVKKWSTENHIYLLEDAAYRELYYDDPPPKSIWSRDTDHETVILAQTYSKSFSPGVRVGLGILPKALVAGVCDCKGNEDFGSTNLSQQILAEIFDSNEYAPHVEGLRNSYRLKRNAMVSAAEKYFSDIEGVSWIHPGGGLYVWMSLPESVETGFDSRLFDVAVHQEKVMFVPGELFYDSNDPNRKTNEMRLSFGIQDEAGIDAGMKQLANAVRTVLSEG